MAFTLIQNVVVVVVLVQTLICPWPTLATNKLQEEPFTPIKLMKPIKPLIGPIGDLVKLRSVDQIPVLTGVPEGFHVLVLTRQGMFYTKAPSTLKGDKQKDTQGEPPLTLTKSQLNKNWTDANVCGVKIKKGGDLMKMVGKLLGKRYADHFTNMLFDHPKLAETRVKVTGTNSVVAKYSALNIIAGMQEQNPEMGGLNLKLSDDEIEANYYFDPQLLNKQDEEKCKVFLMQATYLVEPQTIMMTAPPFVGKSVDDVYQQYRRLQLERLEELELPDWTKENKGRETLRQMKGAAITRMKNLIGDDIALWKYFVSYLLNCIFKEFILYDHADPTLARISRFHVHVVDDYMMTALVWWLRLDGEIDAAFGDPVGDYYPQPGDSLILELDYDKMMTASYMRLVGDSESQVGFKRLSLSKKTEDFAIKFNSPEGTKTYQLSTSDLSTKSVHAGKFYNTLIGEREWGVYCNNVNALVARQRHKTQ